MREGCKGVHWSLCRGVCRGVCGVGECVQRSVYRGMWTDTWACVQGSVYRAWACNRVSRGVVKGERVQGSGYRGVSGFYT